MLLEKSLPVFDFKPLEQSTQPLPGNDKIDFNNLADTLNELQAEDNTPYVYLPEVGNSYFASYSLKVRASSVNRGWLTNPWYGAMGTSMPYARVVAQSIKEKAKPSHAVVITGDGGFHFQLNELIHFLKDKSDVTIVYMRNNIFHLGKSSDTYIYHCNDVDFDVHKLISAYQGQSKTCDTIAQFKAYFKECVQPGAGIRLIEVPAEPVEEKQCNEIRLLNLYIKAKNGQPEAVEQWRKVTE